MSKNPVTLVAKLLVVIWGIVGLLQGAALSFFISGADRYSPIAFVELVYDSVFVAGLISFFSSRIASYVLFGATLVAIAILSWTRTFGHGAATAPSLLLAIAIRPALGTLVFFFISLYEGRLAGQNNTQK